MGPSDEGPNFCPMKTAPDLFEDARSIVAKPEIGEMMRGVATTWKKTKLSENRIESTMVYADIMGFKKLGLAFCVALASEARVVSAIFEDRGFKVISGCCMTGGFSSDDIGLPEEVKMRPGIRQPQCNPVGQALMMNKHETDLNVIIGLCVGDDALFIKHSAAPVTVLAVKDMMTSHNPLAAIPEYEQTLGL
jgi:uncharacterized metal-binding protein